MCVIFGDSDGAETIISPDTDEAETIAAIPHAHTHRLPDGTILTHSHNGHNHPHHHDYPHQGVRHNHNHNHPHTHSLPLGTIITHSHDHSHDHSHVRGTPSHEHDSAHLHTRNGHSHDHNHPTHDRSLPFPFLHPAPPSSSSSPSPPPSSPSPSTQNYLPIDPVITTPTPVSETRHLNREDLIAAQNRGWFKGRNVLALNLVGLPGSGKTALIARTFADLRTEVPFAVVQMDYVIGSDADHLQAMGCRVIQTERGKHLDASMVEQGLEKLNPPLNSVVIIENANYAAGIPLPDLGERAKVVVLSVTEGDDKPLKYPQMFRDSQVMLLTKVDLLPYVSFSVQQCWNHARQVNPQIQLLQVSSVTGEGMDVWYTWLRRSRPTS